MRAVIVLLFTLFLPASLLADNFISVFMEKYAQEDKLLNNVNIGKTMLDMMAENTADGELKNVFKELDSICIVSSDDVEDSKYYFEMANDLFVESFTDYEEVVSVNETGSKISVWMNKQGEEMQELILVALDGDGGFSVISVSGKIDFDSLSKLSGSLKSGEQLP